MVQVTFADLTHVGIVIDANYSPLSVGYVAAYAQHHLKDEIDIRLFKYPSEFARYLDNSIPTIACFSNYMWNQRLQLEFARRIKLRHPEVITVFGGPNYPTDGTEQKQFLHQHEEIDFYIDGEGEPAFVELFRALEEAAFDVAALKSSLIKIPSVHYLAGQTIVQGQPLPRLRDLDTILPSPYLSGVLDEFFDDQLHPLVQTSRGCPYSCTFCHDGIAFMNKTLRFSQERITKELEYIAERVKVPGLTLADLNWGMFPEDIETARTLAQLRQNGGWPVNVVSATAKTQKQRIIEMARILGDSIRIGASIQSTDPAVLSNIKRTNIGHDVIVKMAKDASQTNTPTFSEVILCLPGDTKEKHFKSILDMIDAGIEDNHSFQFIMLPGTESDTSDSREKFGYETRFRVLPRCFGRYELYGEDVPVAEIHEVCVANNTMSFDDYLDCRDFDLSVAIFNNGRIFEELLGMAEVLQIPRSEMVAGYHEMAMVSGGKLEELYNDFRADENRNFWQSETDLEAFLFQSDGLDTYLSGYYGANQIFKYRSIAVFELLEETTDVAIATTRAELLSRNLLDPLLEKYLDELKMVILARKSEITDVDRTLTLPVHFDFATLDTRHYLVDPRDVFVENGLNISVYHTDFQRNYLNAYFNQYTPSLDGLRYFIHRQPAGMLYRQVGPEIPKA